MKIVLSIIVSAACALALAAPARAEEQVRERARDGSGVAKANPWAGKHPMVPRVEDTCYTYSYQLFYCNVVKIKNGVCVHNRWGQYHSGQTGPDCLDCFDTVDNTYDFLVDHYETPLENGCYPYNDCQYGTVYTCI